MKPKYYLDIEIDKLTNSIVNTISGDSFETEVSEVSQNDLKAVTKTREWQFDWKAELAESDREVHKLTITGNPKVIQGLVSISDFKHNKMGYIKEPKGIDLVISPMPLTIQDRESISAIISTYKKMGEIPQITRKVKGICKKNMAKSNMTITPKRVRKTLPSV